MSVPTDISDEEMLARLAARDLAAAEHVHAKLMAAEEASEIAELGRTYQRFARSLRQTLALKARFRREQDQAARETAAPQEAKPPTSGVAAARRVGEVRAAVLRVVWDEAEDEDAREDYEEELDALLQAASERTDFCAEPLDDHVARTCLRLGLSPHGAQHWRNLPDPPGDERGEAETEPDIDSSA